MSEAARNPPGDLAFPAAGAAPALRVLAPPGGFRHAARPERGLELWLHGHDDVDAAALLDAHAREGHAAWRAQRGRFVAFVRETSPARVSVVTDRHAGIPVYRSAGANGVALSSSLRAGVRAGLHPVAWDPEGVAQLLAIGQCLEQRTALRGVTRLAKASITTFDRASGAEACVRYWSATEALAAPRERLADRRDELLARFREAVDLHARRGSLCTTLSGGLDTRVIAAALVAGGHRPRAFTLGVPGGSDDRIARRVAAALGLEQRFVPIDAASVGSLLPLMQEAALRLDGRGLVEGVAVRRLSREFPAGATLFQGAFAELAKLEGAHEVRIRFGRVPGRDALPTSIAGCFSRNLEGVAPALAPAVRSATAPLETLAGRVRRLLDVLEPIEALTAFYLEERLEQALASHALYGDGDRVAAPFADPLFLDALLHVRGQDRVRPALHQFFLRRLAPALLAIPDSNTALPAWAPGPLRDLGRTFQGAALRLGLGFAQAHDDYCAKLRSIDPDVHTLLRRGRLLADGVLCEEGIESLWRGVEAGSEHTAATLQRVLLLDLWATSLDERRTS